MHMERTRRRGEGQFRAAAVPTWGKGEGKEGKVNEPIKHPARVPTAGTVITHLKGVTERVSQLRERKRGASKARLTRQRSRRLRAS